MEGLSYRELVLDDKPIPYGSFSNVAQINNISIGYIKIPHGSHTLKHSSGGLPLGGILYGGAFHESYAFPVGQRFTPINQECQPQHMVVGDGLDNDCDGRVDEEICNDYKDNDVDGKENEDCVTELTRPTTPTTPTTLTTRTTTAKQPTTKRTTTMAKTKLTTTSTSSTARPTTPTTSTTQTTTTKQPTTKRESTTTAIVTTLSTTKLTTSSTSQPMNLMTETTTAKQTTKTLQVSMDQIRPQWFILTEIGIISGVAIVVLGAIGVCCKKCWGLLKDRDDDDDEEEKRHRRKRRSTTKLALGGPSIRPMYM